MVPCTKIRYRDRQDYMGRPLGVDVQLDIRFSFRVVRNGALVFGLGSYPGALLEVICKQMGVRY